MKLPKKDIFFALMAIVLPWSAHAITTLKQVQVSDGAQIDLLFDGAVTPAQIKTEFFNDIIQLSINNVAVYPAKISSVSGSDVTKIFAYQYSPKLVRCRLTVKGKAEEFENRLKLQASGKVLTVRLNEEKSSRSDRLTVRAAHADAGSSAPALATTDPEEKALLERVMKAPLPGTNVGKKIEVSPNQQSPVQNVPLATNGKTSSGLGSGKNVIQAPSPIRTLGMLFVVIAVFGAFVLVMKKFGLMKGKGSKANSSAVFQGMARKKSLGMGDLIQRFVRHGLGSGDKMIEVVSTHYLGPKQSIAMVRVAGRLLVLGVSNESINLITELPADAQLDGFDLDAVEPARPAVQTGAGATAAGRGIFSDILNHEQVKPSAPPSSGNTNQNVRAQIRNRLGAMKPL